MDASLHRWIEVCRRLAPDDGRNEDDATSRDHNYLSRLWRGFLRLGGRLHGKLATLRSFDSVRNSDQSDDTEHYPSRPSSNPFPFPFPGSRIPHRFPSPLRYAIKQQSSSQRHSDLDSATAHPWVIPSYPGIEWKDCGSGLDPVASLDLTIPLGLIDQKNVSLRTHQLLQNGVPNRIGLFRAAARRV